MGFMDKAKKLAEQAQAKLDEAQQQFNASQGNPGTSASSGPAVEYDAHGRPIPSGPPPDATTPPHGDPLGAGHESAPPPPPPHAAPMPDPAAPRPAPPSPSPPGEQPPEDPNRPSYEPPKLSGGDPLAG
jgi:formin 2/WAS/WASL-interacting protein